MAWLNGWVGGLARGLVGRRTEVRDAEADAVFALKRAPGNPAWRLTGEVDPGQGGPKLSPERQAILDVLKAAAPDALGPKAVAAQTWAGQEPVPQQHINAVSELLRKLRDQGALTQREWGTYQFPT